MLLPTPPLLLISRPVASLSEMPTPLLRYELPTTVVPAEAPETARPAFVLPMTALPASTFSPCAPESTRPREFCMIALPVMKLPALLPVAKTP